MKHAPLLVGAFIYLVFLGFDLAAREPEYRLSPAGRPLMEF
jgi:hypothetical protein